MMISGVIILDVSDTVLDVTVAVEIIVVLVVVIVEKYGICAKSPRKQGFIIFLPIAVILLSHIFP